MFFQIFAIVAPIFTCAGIGFGWAKSGRKYDTNLITAIVSYFGTPCLVFHSISTVELSLSALGSMAAAALTANALFIILGSLILVLAKLPQRAFLQALSFPNIGNIGLPLCFLAFGDEGLALGATFFAVYAAFQLTFGAAFVSGQISFHSLAKLPIVPATVLAVIFLFTDTAIPLWLANTTKLIGDLTIPLMLLTLGYSISQIRINKMTIPLLLSLVRLLMGFAVGVGLAWIFNLTGVDKGVVILQCSMPTAVFCFLFAQQYNQRPTEVAGIVIISTLVSFGALPLLLWYVL